MKISEMLKLTDKNWVRKPSGFRVRFQKREDGKWVQDYMPDPVEAAFDSDVVAWRSAWKLFQDSRPGEEELINLTVVDDRDEPIRYYATGNFEVYNPREGIPVEPSADKPAEAPPETETPLSERQIEADARGSEVQPSSEESDK